MAITDINISETLEAGAPSIKYTGNMNPNMQMASAPDPMDERNSMANMLFNKNLDQLTETELIQLDEAIANSLADGGRVHFGLGSMLKSIGKGVKKIAKSPLGKAALIGGGLYGLNQMGGLKGLGSFFGKDSWSPFKAMLTSEGWTGPTASGLGKLLGKTFVDQSTGALTGMGWAGLGAATLGGAAAAFSGMEKDEVAELQSNPEALRAHLTQYYSNANPDKSDEEVSAWVATQMYSKGGRVGFAERGTIKDMTISTSQNDPRNMTTLEIISMIKGGRSTPEMFEELRVRGIEGIDEIDLAEFGKTGGSGDVAYSFDERLVDEYNPKTGTAEESFLMKMRESNPDVYGNYQRPHENFFHAAPVEKAHGGRMGFAGRGIVDLGEFSLSERLNARNPENELLAQHSQIGKLPWNITRRILELNRGGKSYEDIAKLTGVAIEDINQMLDLANNPDYIHPISDFKQMDPNKFNVDKYAVWDDIVTETDQIRARPEHLDYRMRGQKFRKADGGRIGFAYGPDQTAQAAGIMGNLPTRNNAAGINELDLRDSGGFIPPVGVKEKADDIPAMLSNNEFVMTADAVRAAGGGSVEKGAQVMYDTMKNLESKVV